MFAYVLLPIFLFNLITEINADIPCPLCEEIIFFGAEHASVPPTFFLLYTRENLYYPENITFVNCSENSNYDPNKKTVILLDGYNGSPNSEHIIFLKQAYLKYEDCNVIVIDWSIASSALIFPTAIRNTLIIGKYIAEQFEIWKKTCKEIQFEKFHVIGFSLGGQTVGFIGKYMKTGKIGRITGLDIVGFCFASFSSKYKLHYTDAKFVDVISVSSATQLIIEQPTGHVHFKPDGGKIGKGCAEDILNLNFDVLFRCTHMRTVYLFTSTFYSECLPVGYQCKDMKTFARGECNKCGEDGKQCAALGIQAEKYSNKIINGTITMYLATTFTDNYCLYHYHVEVTLASKQNSSTEAGKLALIINNSTVNQVLNSDLYIQDATDIFNPNKTYGYLMITTHKIDPITNLEFFWYTTRPKIDNKLYVKCIKIVPMNNLEMNRSKLTYYGTTNGKAIYPQETVPIYSKTSC
ncbi:lipase member I-like isoform X1 [Centruroides vittatus]|uniref:lipase member I-like isoform X1 n=1 Tax=Centruroides vittatus TaxID=120091 RepID=UPI0035104799